MSNLKAETTTLKSFNIFPSSVVCFEDSLKSDQFSIYNLLRLSSLRDRETIEDRAEYQKQLVDLLKSKLERVEDSPPIGFVWNVDNQEYHSTSLIFELFFTTLSLAQQLFHSQTNYPASIHLLKQCREILSAWRTSDLVYPHCPYVCTDEYIKNLLYVVNGSMLFNIKGKKEAVALSSAMKCSGMVSYHIPYFSEIALNHYLVARALLFQHLALKNKENLEQGDMANKSFTCAKEAYEICKLVDRSKCHLNTDLDSTLNQLLDHLPEYMKSMQNVYYAVEEPLDSITLPASISNDKIEAR